MAEFDAHKANEVTAPAGDTPLEANAGELEGGALSGTGLGMAGAAQNDLGSGAFMETALAVGAGEAMGVDTLSYGALMAGALAGRNAVEQVDEEERGPQDVAEASWAAQIRDGR